MRSFDMWTYEEVEDTFGIVSVDSLPQFDDWLASDSLTDKAFVTYLNRLAANTFRR